MTARIYKPARTAMQSGQANTKEWVLDYEPEQPRTVEPLMGWTSTGRHEAGSAAALRHQGRGHRLLRAQRHPAIRCSRPSRRCASASPIPTISPIRAAKPGRTERPTGSKANQAGLFFFDRAVGGRRPVGGKLPALRGGALTQQRNETVLGHRLTEQKSLAVIAAHADQRERVGRLLDPDSDGDAAEIVREIDDGLAQRRVDLVGPAIGNKGAVELEFGERQRFKPGQRPNSRGRNGRSRDEHRGAAAFSRIVRQREVGDDLLFHHVDDQARPFLELRRDRSARCRRRRS